MELVFFRCSIATIIGFIGLQNKGVSWIGSNRKLLLLRGFFGTAALYTFFLTLQHLPLGTAVTIQYLSPIFTTIAAIFILKEKINTFINYRRSIFNIYKTELKKITNSIKLPCYNIGKPSYHLFLISVNFKKIKSSKDKLLKFLKKNNILCQYHYIPIYKFKLFNKKINLNYYKGAEFYYRNSLSLPIFYNLRFNYQKRIMSQIKIFLNRRHT
jgi:hypothetical protein